jgi:hypothetical protein
VYFVVIVIDAEDSRWMFLCCDCGMVLLFLCCSACYFRLLCFDFLGVLGVVENIFGTKF